MNINQYNVLLALLQAPFSSQRELAKRCGISLGGVNTCLQALRAQGLLDEGLSPTEQARQLARERKPRCAVILAAGFGMRMVPINMETPKGLLEVRGEVLIERLIRQLQQAGIQEIYVVVGFMKERFEYLIDAFGVELVVNPEYARKNNLHSLALVKHRLSNCYIVPLRSVVQGQSLPSAGALQLVSGPGGSGSGQYRAGQPEGRAEANRFRRQ